MHSEGLQGCQHAQQAEAAIQDARYEMQDANHDCMAVFMCCGGNMRVEQKGSKTATMLWAHTCPILATGAAVGMFWQVSVINTGQPVFGGYWLDSRVRCMSSHGVGHAVSAHARLARLARVATTASTTGSGARGRRPPRLGAATSEALTTCSSTGADNVGPV
jgi:hypothetical protein